jgi:small subunit ribosomal protein S8
MVGDPIGDFITRLKNASAVKKETVSIPFSQLKLSVAEKLKQYNFIQDVETGGKKVRKTLEVTLAYRADGTPRIQDAKRLSKPGRRLYTPSRGIMPVKHGYGLIILSTPKGILSGDEAKKAKVGGETLFMIW